MSAAVDPKLDLLEHGPCGLVSTTPQGKIVFVNATLAAWLGKSRDELLAGRTFQQLMSVPGRVFWETHFAPLLRMQGFVNEVAVDLVRHHGETMPTFISANEDRDERGAVRSVRIAVFRAANRRTYERELLLGRQMAEQAMKAKADFLAFFAHEVRNPLSAVELAAESLARIGVSERAARPLNVLQRSLTKVLVVLQNMLDFSKIEAGKAALEQQRFDLREIIHGAVQTCEPAAERKGLPIHMVIEPSVPLHVTGDGVKIGQVIANLVGNAVKFTERGSVTVNCSAVGNDGRMVDLAFEVTDTGIGIAPERLAHVFEEFEQAGPHISAKYGGTGLGLAICRRIVEMHGSTIDVTSQQGAGTTFRFQLSLPIADEAVLQLGAS